MYVLHLINIGYCKEDQLSDPATENIQLKNISSRRIQTLIASSLKMNTGRWLATMRSLGMIRLVCILNIFFAN